MTKIITANELEEAAKSIAEGGIVAFPTETVYGLGADAFSDSAIDKVYKAKGRPSDNPLIIHIAEKSDINKLVSDIPENAKILMDNFWPGPLTIIFNKDKSVPYRVTGGLETVAVRCPSNKLASDLITLSGKFIAAPSANLSGSPSPTTARHVVDDLFGRVDYIVSGDDCKIGLESTIIDVTSDEPVILRPGAVTLEMVKSLIPNAKMDSDLLKPVKKPKCPGMKYKHYSPRAEVEVVCGDKEKVMEYIRISSLSCDKFGVYTYKGGDYDNAACVISGGDTMQEYGARLFYSLRVFDEYKVTKIFAEFIEEDGIGAAVKNRLYKAAGNNITRV